MNYNPENPLIIQSDLTVLLEVISPKYEAARNELVRFAELEKSPEHMHTYRIHPLSLWNAAASKITADQILSVLETYSKYEIPQNVGVEICEAIARYGKVLLSREGDAFILSSDDALIITEVCRHKTVKPYIEEQIDANRVRIAPLYRGHIKQALTRIGYPVKDTAGYLPGAALAITPRDPALSGNSFVFRDYQMEAADIFHAGGGPDGGSGTIVLPCGAGKTIVGIAAMTRLQTQTLILTTNITASRQWRSELIDKTDLTLDQIGEYSGEVKEIKPVTIATYNILTWRKSREDDFPHFAIFNQGNWGLIIYDEVHLLPAPVFRFTAELQSRRRLGLTATLVREDGLETDVFSLIGPKRYDVPWRELEAKGWIATAECCEIRLPLPQELRLEYAVAGGRGKFRIAAENPNKLHIIRHLLAQHKDAQVLVIGQYIDQIEHIAKELNAPIIMGKTPNEERGQLYDEFRRGERKLLVVSKVANFAIDLPDANVAIQISGTFGSRQEEAQRLGRILRPKSDGSIAYFYSLVTRDTREQEFARNRQTFLTEQGYRYIIRDAQEMFEESEVEHPV
ncbi:MAG: DNA excision repair protein ERCC-3 [Candidatus Latescibacterota bacterium]|jgi:DNA excision repair protein ERCC-3